MVPKKPSLFSRIISSSLRSSSVYSSWHLPRPIQKVSQLCQKGGSTPILSWLAGWVSRDCPDRWHLDKDRAEVLRATSISWRCGGH
ncbi:TPA: hypothetical protein N0F65_000818 [Lagenidium giganteum]|uniref:Uncharacterized protein n=1 Tax=Lagenidium giganteum TaxID=4803 RepID=A0AAV2YZ32_9STRA|nr:TPA: hypothetical protein N0F65_000818 [Lagenidium giganteum]